jgi:integrase
MRGHKRFAIVAYSIATSAESVALWRAKREDIKDDLSEVHVRGTKNENRDRDVPIQLLALGYLLAFAREHADGVNSLFLDREGTFRNRLRGACKRAGLPGISPTDHRRTHGKWLRLAGVSISNIYPSMGHSDGRMLERGYGKVTAVEIAHVLAAQIAATQGAQAGSYLGGGGGGSGAYRHSWQNDTAHEAAIFQEDLVPRHGIEPRTRGFSIPCSTN